MNGQVNVGVFGGASLRFVSGSGKTYFAGGIDIGFLASAAIRDDSASADVKDSLNDVDLSAGSRGG